MSSAAQGPERRYFFAYSRTDSTFVLKLATDLRAAGVNLWLDQLDVIGGQRWDHAVEAALEQCEGMIAVLSPDALASHNVMDEVSYALEKAKLVVPVLLRPADMPFRLRRVQYVDFTGSYDAGLAQLLRALGPTRALDPPRPVQPASVAALPTPNAVATPITAHEARPSTASYLTRARAIGAVVGAICIQILWILGMSALYGVMFSGAGVYDLEMLLAAALAGAICGSDRQRIKSAAIGAAITAVVLVPLMLGFSLRQDWLLADLRHAAYGALVGAICRTERWAIVAAIVTGSVVYVARFQFGFFLSPAHGAVIGALVAVFLIRRRRAASHVVERKMGDA